MESSLCEFFWKDINVEGDGNVDEDTEDNRAQRTILKEVFSHCQVYSSSDKDTTSMFAQEYGYLDELLLTNTLRHYCDKRLVRFWVISAFGRNNDENILSQTEIDILLKDNFASRMDDKGSDNDKWIKLECNFWLKAWGKSKWALHSNLVRSVAKGHNILCITRLLWSYYREFFYQNNHILGRKIQNLKTILLWKKFWRSSSERPKGCDVNWSHGLSRSL